MSELAANLRAWQGDMPEQLKADLDAAAYALDGIYAECTVQMRGGKAGARTVRIAALARGARIANALLLREAGLAAISPDETKPERKAKLSNGGDSSVQLD